MSEPTVSVPPPPPPPSAVPPPSSLSSPQPRAKRAMAAVTRIASNASGRDLLIFAPPPGLFRSALAEYPVRSKNTRPAGGPGTPLSSARLVGRPPDDLRRLPLEPLLVDPRVGAGVDRLFEAFVQFAEQLLLSLRDGESIFFVGRDHRRDIEPLAGTHHVLGHRLVDHDRVGESHSDRVDRVRSLRIGPNFAGFGVFLDEFLPGRALLDADFDAFQVLDRIDVAALLDQDRLFGEVVGIGEVDRLLPLLSDRRRRGYDFEAVVREVAEDRLEGGVDEFGLTADVPRHRFHQLDVEAGVVGRIALLERRVGDVGADRERLSAAAAPTGAVAGAPTGAVPAGSKEEGEDDRDPQGEHRVDSKVAHLGSPPRSYTF